MLVGAGFQASWSLYMDWENEQVMTIVGTTSFAPKDIEFPVLTICTKGINEEIMNNTILRDYFEFLEKTFEIKVNTTPAEFSKMVISYLLIRSSFGR